MHAQTPEPLPLATTRILGLPFLQSDPQELVQALESAGGLLVAPSGPGLAWMDHYPDYTQALLDSDYILIDSGFLALFWRLIKGERLRRISGLLFFQLLQRKGILARANESLWVMPSQEEADINCQWLEEQGVHLPPERIHIAPHYPEDALEDLVLLEKITKLRPHWVLIHIGGGKQEVLGAYLKSRLPYRPALICTGAAVAFLTGVQADIPAWADRIYLGWLLRILKHPRRFLPRYLSAFRLAWLLCRYRRALPVSNELIRLS